VIRFKYRKGNNMEIEKQLKDLMIKKSGSVNRFAQECGLATSTVATVFTRGVDKTNINTIIKICRTLNISADELAKGRITPSFFVEASIEHIDMSKLNETNQARLKAYYDALIDSQNGNT